MFPYLLAAVRPTEAWSPWHVVATVVTIAVVVAIVARVRVRRDG